MIDELRATLERQVGRVVPEPDPYHRLLSRRRRRRRNFIATAAAAVLLVGVPGGWLASSGRTDHAHRTDFGTPSPLLRALLDSPARGSLATDVSFLAQMRGRTARDADLPHRGDVWMPTDPARITVLFAGEVPGGGRLVIVAGDTATPLQANYIGSAGTAADHMRLSTSDELRPVVEYSGGIASEPLSDFALRLGPAGSRVELSGSARYLADGRIIRSWAVQPHDYVLLPTTQLEPSERVRFTVAGERLYEGPMQRTVELTATVNPQPVSGGRAEPAAARQVADVIASTTGLTAAQATYKVLWSDEIPMVGLPNSKTAIIATVMAVTHDGGGPYATFAFDPTDPYASARNVPTGGGVLGDPAKSLIAMRLPYYAGTAPPDTLQIVAPRSAARVEVLRPGHVVVSTALDHGAGHVSLPIPSTAQVRAYDVAGRLVAQRSFADNESSISNLYEPTYRAW